MNNRYKFLLVFLFFGVTFTLGFLYKPPVKGFFSGDPEIKELRNALESFEQANGRPPDTLQELVPKYLSEVKVPNSVDSMEYTISDEQNTWELVFVINCFGSKTEIGGSNIVKIHFLNPEDVLQCRQ